MGEKKKTIEVFLLMVLPRELTGEPEREYSGDEEWKREDTGGELNDH